MQGWISVYRKLKENPIYNEKPFDRTHAWIDLIMGANHQDNEISLGNEVILVKRGSMITSVRKLCDTWGWSNTKVENYLKLLQKQNMIAYFSDTKKTTINIVNYCIYQDVNDADSETKTTQKRNENDTKTKRKRTNNNVNNGNNIYTVEFEKFYSFYPNSDNKQQTFKNWNTCLKTHSVEQIMQATQNYKKKVEVEGREKQYIKNSSNFLGKEKVYMDYILCEPVQQNKIAPLKMVMRDSY